MKLLKNTIVFLAIFAFSSVLITAQETGGIKGKVRNTRGGGIPEATITVSQDGQDIKTVSTDSRGDFVMDGVKSGKYSIVVSKSGFASGTISNVEIGKKKIRDLGSRLVLTADDGTLVLIKGSVFNADGRSLYGAKVEIEKVSGSGKKPNPYYTSESGEFTFRFPEGAATYRVTASAKGKTASKEIAVDSAAIYRVAITLDIKEEKKENQ